MYSCGCLEDQHSSHHNSVKAHDEALAYVGERIWYTDFYMSIIQYNLPAVQYQLSAVEFQLKWQYNKVFTDAGASAGRPANESQVLPTDCTQSQHPAFAI